MTINIAICDDDREAAWKIAGLVAQKAPRAKVSTFSNAEKLLCSEEQFDIVFLDIEMRGMNGIEAANQLHPKHHYQYGRPYIIFISSYPQYMPSAFDVGAFNFIVKPINEGEFDAKFGKALALVKFDNQPDKSVVLKTENQSLRRIYLRRIEYIESIDKRMIIHTLDGSVVCIDKMRRLEDELKERFFRCHRSYLVNLDMVLDYTRDTITLSSGAKVLMAKKNYELLPQAILRYEMLQEGNVSADQ